MNQSTASLPPLEADLLLLHAPAIFEFRNRRDIYFPFLGTSGDVPITPLYEYFPLGFKTLQRYLGDRGFTVKIINLSSLLVRYPQLKLETVLESIDVTVIGIDLHWMIHVQGSLAVAERIKISRPDISIVFGGISSTYYAAELMRYPFIDMVMRGYETHEPMCALLSEMASKRNLNNVPNLVWKDDLGNIVENDFAHKPNVFACGIDWSTNPERPNSKTLPILELMSTQNAGCTYNCGWCGGSREAFQRIYNRQRTVARKSRDEIRIEFESTHCLDDAERYHLYSVGSYNEPRSGIEFFIDRISESNFKSVSYEQFFLTPTHILKRMAAANSRTSITLSPESHDLRISKLAGRGVYTNRQLEEWIEKALEIGIYNIDIWYFIGMPEQDKLSVDGTIAYCKRLLEKFQGKGVNPMICPMIPFLDPASTFFENSYDHGYHVFYRTVEEHRSAMERASIINRINYETKWLSRSDLVNVGFRAVRSLMEAKGQVGMLPSAIAKNYVRQIDDALDFIDIVHRVDCMTDNKARRRELDHLGDDIQQRNDTVLFSGVMNQAFPVNRSIGGRWFDELGWSQNILDMTCNC